MSWLAVWLIGTACADLAHSVRPVRLLPGFVGAAATLATGLLAGLTGGVDVAVLLGLAVLVVLWDAAVRYGFGTGRVAWPLLLWGGVFVGLLLAAGAASPVGGVVDSWREATPFAAAGSDSDRLLLMLAVLSAQLSTGNVVVRLVLTGTGTVNPAKGLDAGRTLKGGRLLGPMERLLIVGLGLAGEVAAAGLVIAAKGLLRWPEIQSRRSEREGPGVDELTEYFLLGSFVSWLWALGGLVLIA
ncbi:hypothetical protein [Nocardioides daejeonensis]|uniref:hypothetical protein n=1 Tax=Nocardioides daejeonensis TaxID=1046556 RepID=UPI000D7458AA|nr:hypothetical protein [Nocardioides daejeonensis]